MGSHLWALVLIFGAKQAKYFRTNLLGVPFRPYPISQPTAREAAASERATTMAAAIYLASSKPSSSPPFLPLPRRPSSSPPSSTLLLPGRGDRRGTVAALLAGGVAALAVAASAQALPVGAPATDAFASLQEPENALSLPTWAIHVSSVIEWVTAMALVWEYGEKSGLQTWKGLCWGMVPLLGGAFCACTWHFFYNSESLEVLVTLQSALTVLGNITMCFAAYRIYKASQEGSTST